MSRYDGGWARYVPVAERRRKAEREMAKLRKKGTVVSPVTIEGKQIAATFWGKAWCDNLESYHDYENRLPRGRTYVRNGSVVDLQIAPHEVTARVSGSSVYSVKVTIAEVAKAQWKSICADCAGGIDSLVELLQGRFSKGVMERICRQGSGLFPKPSEIRFSCSCPDGASMCKHVAATMYGIGARFDSKPELLFRLRGVNENDLVANIGNVLPMSRQGPAAGKVLEADDMAALFGLDMGDGEATPPLVVPKQKRGSSPNDPMKPILVKKDQVKPGGLKDNKLKTAPVAKKTVVTGPLKVIPGPVTKKPGAPKPARAKVTVADKAQAKPVAWQKLVAPKQVPAVGVTKPGRGPKRGLHAGID